MIKHPTKRWIALFSHTGSEIHNLSKRLKIKPNSIITNKPPGEKTYDQFAPVLHVNSKPTVQQYRSFLDTDAFITLHGWMRIIPEEICNEYEIYNLHPGLITQYPELKGKDPQSRVLGKSYDSVGCVIHRATAELDSGEVLMERSTPNIFSNEQSLTSHLHHMSTDMWFEFISNYK